jgi:hypothetical protein
VGLIWLLVLNGYLYLSGAWLGLDLITDTKDMCLKEFGHHILEKIVNYSRFNNLQDLEGLCD